jgi:hypothetical protein
MVPEIPPRTNHNRQLALFLGTRSDSQERTIATIAKLLDNLAHHQPNQLQEHSHWQ